MIYLVLEYASGGEIFGNNPYFVFNKTTCFAFFCSNSIIKLLNMLYVVWI